MKCLNKKSEERTELTIMSEDIDYIRRCVNWLKNNAEKKYNYLLVLQEKILT